MMQRIILYCAITSTLCLHGMEKIENFSLKTTTFNEKLEVQIEEKNTILCVGLDPDWTKMPDSFTRNIDPLKDLQKAKRKILSFLQDIVKLTHQYAACYKLQKACYEGWEDLMQQVVSFIKTSYPLIPIINDCKVCDIENTMNFYHNYNFNTLKVDAITVVPYMGQDVVQGFINYPLKTGIVVVQTSNPSGECIQKLGTLTATGNHISLWFEILRKVKEWNKNNNLMAVLSANLIPQEYNKARETMGENFFFLVPGVGAQGADPKNVLTHLMNNKKSGVLVVAARSILYPYKKESPEWQHEVSLAVKKLQEELNTLRQSSNL